LSVDKYPLMDGTKKGELPPRMPPSTDQILAKFLLEVH